MFHCRRSDYKCVPNTDEVCDGEDNNGNGFVDEHGFQATTRPIGSTWLDGGPAPSLYRVAVAWNGQRHLIAWTNVLPSRTEATLFYALADAQGNLLGSVRRGPTWVDQMRSPVGPVAAVGNGDGFLIAYAPERFSPEVSVVEVDGTGASSSPAPIGNLQGDLVLLDVIVSGGAPVIVGGLGQREFATSLVLLRPGTPAETIAQVENDAQIVELRVAARGNAVVVGWVETPARDVTGGTASRVRIRLPDGSLMTGPSSDRLALKWVGEAIGVSWVDFTDPLRPAIVFQRLDATGTPLEAPSTVQDNVTTVDVLRLAGGVNEAAVGWTARSSGFNQTFMRRVDPERGAFGVVVPVGPPGSLLLDALQATGAAYSAWLFPLGPGPGEAADVRCSDLPAPDAGPPPDAGISEKDGGADAGPNGGLPDGGLPDAGAPDAGMASECSPGDGGLVVRGQVQWIDRSPSPSIPVLVGSCVADTDAEGRFEARAAGTPYDLAVAIQDGTTPLTLVFPAATELSPVIRLPGKPGGRNQVVAFGESTGGFADLYAFFPSDVHHAIVFNSPFEASLFWHGTATTDVDLVVVAWDASQNITAGQVFNLTGVTAGTRIDLGMLNPQPVSTRSVTVNLPAFEEAQVELVLSRNGQGTALLEEMPSAPSLSMTVPSSELAPFAALSIRATLDLADGSQALLMSPALNNSTTQVTITIPPTTSLTYPQPGATGVGPLDRLELTPVSSATGYTALVLPSDGSSAILIFGKTTTLSLPDLGKLDRQLPQGETAGAIVGAFYGESGYADLLTGGLIPSVLVNPTASVTLSPPVVFVP